MPTLALACGFLVGAALGRRLGWPWEAALLVGVAALLAGLWLSQPRLRLAALGVVALAVGLARAGQPGLEPGAEALRAQVGRPIVLEGIVAAQPEAAGQAQRLTVAVRSVGAPPGPATGEVSVVTAPYTAYRFGDLLEIKGTAKEERRRGGTWPVLRYPRIAVLGHGQGGAWRQPLEELRARLAGRLARALPEPQAGLAQGIFLGLRSNLPPELNAAFKATGTSHLIAISGQNITIVVGLVSGLLLWILGRRRALLALLALVWLYAVLAGAEPPVVRATVMASAYLLGSALGRQTSGLVALALALAVMVGVQPLVLSDVSFQLSAAAMVGLVLLAPRLQAVWSRRPAPSSPPAQGVRAGLAAWLSQNLAVSVAAVAFTWPIIAYTFHSFSWVGVPATLAGLPALPFIIASSAITALAGLLSEPLATALGWVAWLPLTYLIAVVELFARVPGAGLQVGALPPEAVAGYYLALGGMLWLWSRRPLPAAAVPPGLWGEAAPRWRWGLGALSAGAVLAWAMALTAPGDELVVRALAVPAGQAVLVEAPGRVRALVDGGPSAPALELALARALPFWDRHLDLIISTGGEVAYLGGLLDVAPRHHPGYVLDASGGGGSLRQEWQRRMADADVRVQPAFPGTVVRLGHGVTVQVLRIGTPTGAQEQLGLLVQYGDVRVLVAREPPGGPAYGDGKERPQIVFVAGGAGAAGQGQPRVVVVSGALPLERQGAAAPGRVILATRGQRDIVLRTDGRRLRLEEGREGRSASRQDATAGPQPR